MRTHRPAHRLAQRPKAEGYCGGDGFTLLEVIVATGLVGLVALAVAPLMLMAVQTSAVAQEATELTNSGTEQMETLRALPFTDGQLAAGGSVVSSDPGYSLDPYDGNVDRYIRWQITDAGDARKHIEMAIGIRKSIWGPPREILLETYRTDLQ
ncbi:MAG: type II secretion system protein [Acidobacteria bacterium]|nr:type II secretion system protein [Acidobacteriota bacterium]